MGIAFADELSVQHRSVLEEHVGEGAAVSVFVQALGVHFVQDQSDSFSFNGVVGELLGLFAETGDRLFWMNRLRCVDADQAYFFVRADDDCVAVDDTDDFSELARAFIDFLGLL